MGVTATLGLLNTSFSNTNPTPLGIFVNTATNVQLPSGNIKGATGFLETVFNIILLTTFHLSVFNIPLSSYNIHSKLDKSGRHLTEYL